MSKRLLYPLIALVVINLMIAAFNFAKAEPFDRYNKPIDIQWWGSACRAYYVVEPNEKKQYAAGVCDGVTQAYLNQLDEWCAPDGVTWGEVETYIGEMAGEAKIEPLSDRDIGEYIASVIDLRWPCE